MVQEDARWMGLRHRSAQCGDIGTIDTRRLLCAIANPLVAPGMTTEGDAVVASAIAARELRVETHIAASPERVWTVLADLKEMHRRSPELVVMLPLLRGGLRSGQQYLGINRRKAAVWPTHNVVTDCEAGRVLAWDTRTSGAHWIYELQAEGGGTRVTHRRLVPRRLTLVSRLYTTLFLRGVDSHSDELERGMATSLDELRKAVEALPDSGR
jgi:uncharacterized protein YndB with AHSA1/START domain